MKVSSVYAFFTSNSFSAKISKYLNSEALKNKDDSGLTGCFTKYFDLWKKNITGTFHKDSTTALNKNLNTKTEKQVHSFHI